MARISDDEINRMRIALARISRLVDRRVSNDGMTRTQLSVLGTLARTKRIGMGELAEIEGLNPTMLSRLVGKLEVAGLLQRTPDDDDRRVVVVEITTAGTRLHANLRRQRTALFARHLGDLPEDEVADLVRAIPALESFAAALRPAERTGARAGARA